MTQIALEQKNLDNLPHKDAAAAVEVVVVVIVGQRVVL